jgi:serine/threonine protein kinase
MNPRKEYGGRSGGATTYDFVAVIGTGAYGTVYKARALHSEDGEWVAIKKIRISTDTEEGMPMCTIREIAMLKQLEKFEHPNIVK